MSQVHRQAAANADAARPLRVVIVARDTPPLVALFADRKDTTTVPVATVAEGLALVATDGADAVLLAPELAEGWATTVAERMAEGIDARIPLLVACRSASRTKVIGERLSGSSVRVIQRGELTAEAAVRFFAATIGGRA